MNTNSKIEWCDSTWNPATGCLHGCEYCYARRIAERFKGWNSDAGCISHVGPTATIMELDRKPEKATKNGQIQTAPFPFGFSPTLHRYRLGEPKGQSKPQKIFVCSMADLFGAWVPDEWIECVFDACKQAPQHTYLFLTKNPSRYGVLASTGKLPDSKNFWYGVTATDHQTAIYSSQYLPPVWRYNLFMSLEPLQGNINLFAMKQYPKWIIMGAMTGPGSKKYQPKREWVESIASDAKAIGVPVFMKDSLIPFVSEEHWRRDFPQGIEKSIN